MKRICCILLLIIVFASVESKAQVNKGDSLALVDLYNSTNGAQWTNNSGWLQGPVGSWVGLRLQGNRVVGIDLNNNNLTGSIPSSIKNLSALSYLYLYQNHIGGIIPASIVNITSLTSIYLFENQLTGSIPANIGRLTSLLDLSIGDNQLSGHIPSSLGKCTHLSFVVMDFNQLSGPIPASLGNTSLSELSIRHNQLSGRIPDSLRHIPTLNELYLDYNQLSGSIPDWIGDSQLYNLFLNNNKFTGSIPESIGGGDLSLNRSYGGLWLSDNQFNGPVPENLNNLYIEWLKVFNNHFTFDGIEYLDAHRNSIQRFEYAPQYAIPLHSANHGAVNTFTVYAGGTLGNNTYKWYKNNVLDTTITADSTFSTADSGHYSVTVTNSVATALTLISDTVFYNPFIAISVQNITATEGNSGTMPAKFVVNLNKAATTTVGVQFKTVDGTAIAGQDYTAKQGTLTFIPGQTSKTIIVNITGDLLKENNEQFSLKLSNALNAVTAIKDSAICTITNDDGAGLLFTAARPSTPTAIRFSPNPVKDVLHIKGINQATTKSVIIVDASGAVVQQLSGLNGSLDLKVNQLPAGTYLVVIYTTAGTVKLPFVKL